MTKRSDSQGAAKASKRRKMSTGEAAPAKRRGSGANAAEQARAQAISLIETLKQAGASSLTEDGIAGLRRTAHSLSELCKNEEYLELVISEGGIEAVVPLLHLHAKASRPPGANNKGKDAAAAAPLEDLEKEASFILGLLAVKPEYQARITQCDALPGLVRLLREYRVVGPPGGAGGASGARGKQTGSGGAARRAADAITNLAHENIDVKNQVREHGGIPPLVALLDVLDVKVQRAAAGALRTLAFKNDDNKKQIVECGALPVLIQMLRAEDAGVHYEAVGVIGNLVHSAPAIKRQVLEEGALQPVIALLGSPCQESQREAALLLGQFATTDADTKAKIVQRGAVPLLVSMLGQEDTTLKEMAAFALGRLAQNSDNQAGIVQSNGLVPLMLLLESKHHNQQHNAAFALYGLAENEDDIPDMIRQGALQRLADCSEHLATQASKDCVQKTIARIEQKLASSRVLNAVVFMLRSNHRQVKRRAALALAKVVPDAQIKSVFVDKQGLDVLLDVLVDDDLRPELRGEAAHAVLELSRKITATAPVDQPPAQPAKTVYLGAEYVNNSTLSDISFTVEGQKFYAHRIALLASSDAFKAMFSSGYREKDAATVDIPNISLRVFTCMMHYIYTGNVEVEPEIATELLQASDQYLLEGLKRLCEVCIAGQLTVESLAATFELSEAFSAPQLAKRCVLFALEHFGELWGSGVDKERTEAEREAMQRLLVRMVPCLRASLVEDASAVGAAGNQGAGGAGQAAADVDA